jgi:hypothetical protein
MTTTYKFSVAPAEGNNGKWIARSMSAPKATEQYAWGTFGIKTNLIGVFSSKEAAIEAMRAEAKRSSGS